MLAEHVQHIERLQVSTFNFFFTKGINGIIHPEIRVRLLPLLDSIKQIGVRLVQQMDDAVAGHSPGNDVQVLVVGHLLRCNI